MAASRDAPRLASKELLLLLLFLQAAVKRLLENKEIIRINFIGQNKTFTKIYILMHNSVDVRRLDFIFLLTSDTSCEPPPYTQKVDLFFFFFPSACFVETGGGLLLLPPHFPAGSSLSISRSLSGAAHRNRKVFDGVPGSVSQHHVPGAAYLFALPSSNLFSPTHPPTYTKLCSANLEPSHLC